MVKLRQVLLDSEVARLKQKGDGVCGAVTEVLHRLAVDLHLVVKVGDRIDIVQQRFDYELGRRSTKPIIAIKPID